MASFFDDVWRWVWNTETKYYDGEITRDTDWGGDDSTENQPVSGGRVQEWLKNEINGKFGVIRMSATINEQNFYSLEMFSTKEDERLYDEDNEKYAGLVTIVTIPISTVQGDSFTAFLSTTLPQNNIVVAGSELKVNFNYRAVRYTQGTGYNEGALGTLVIQRSTDNGSTWDEVGREANKLTSREPNDTESVDEIDLGKYLTQGKQMIRVRATYNYEYIASGEIKAMNSPWVNIGASITKTTLKLNLLTPYYTPLNAKDANNNDAPFSLLYETMGSVAKTLFVNVTGSTGVVSSLSYPLSGSETSKNISIEENATYGYMTHGVKKVEAWMECEDGLNGTLKSNVLVNRLMVVNENTPGYDADKAYLLLQNVDGEIENFVQANLADYAVYAKDTSKEVQVAFLLTSHTTDYETQKPDTEYFRLEANVKPQTRNSLLATAEIEANNDASALDMYTTFFRVRRLTTTTSGTSTTITESDFIKESTITTSNPKGETAYRIDVDNTNGMTPITGATFLMNPKVRSKNEANPRRILNAKNNNAVVDSEWKNFGFINDGWMADAEGNKILRVMAGSELTIVRNVWARFRQNPESSMTFEIDFKVSNVTNATDPIVQMFSGTASSFRGLKLNALEGWLMNATEQSKDDTLFAWGEDERIHLSINLNHRVKPNKGDVKFTGDNATKADGYIALARVILNGDCVREVPFSITNKDEWSTSDEGRIIIGNEGADIDIYSIRAYEGDNAQLEMTDILKRNYPASLTTAAQKEAHREKNDLLGEGGLIDIEKAKLKGLNCYVWHGVLPYKFETSEQKGWVEIWRYDSQGNYLPEYSGTICKATGSLTAKGQGTTAKTYYDWNVQEDSSKVKFNFAEQRGTILVALKYIHESIVVGKPYEGVIDEDNNKGGHYEGLVVDVYGGNLGKNYPLENTPMQYPYVNGNVMFPDGWVDGNGMYRGMGYRVAEGTALAQKRVIKINYASSMQSHLIGACNTYDLLHRAVVGDTPLQQLIPDAVSAKRTEPFMMFNQEGNGNVYFKGMGTYGAGKADKVAWGFVKKKMPMYALIEGSDNDPVMTNFLVPFDKNTAVYSPNGEGWKYNGQQSWDFDMGNTTDKSDLGYTTDGTLNDDNEVEMPTDAITQRWADIHNFIYLHSTNLKYFVGTFEDFKKSKAAEDTKYKYWCTGGDQALHLMRYDFINNTWMPAGLLLGSGYYGINLKTNATTSKAYNRWTNEGSGDYEKLNDYLKEAFVSDLRRYLKYFINEKSLQFNYCYVLGFLAGTDNSAKNTYYKIDPIGVQMDEDSTFASWFKNRFGHDFDFTSVHQLYFDGDDMDSIFRTNNNAHQTKPYYIDRMHPYADDDSNTCLYEGMTNQLFNFVEKAYAGTGELQSMMLQILNAAHGLVNDKDAEEGLVGGKSLWGFMNKYFFNIQRYFPQIAYMEQARIRYEFPQLLGYRSSGESSRGVMPITQSLGSQLQNEMQYMNQRVIYMTSYAGYGEWGGHEEHPIGINDMLADFSFYPAAMPDGSAASYTFTITPHQYIYPSWYESGTTYATNQRTAPGKTCTFTFKNKYTGGDAGVGIHGINYISDLGNFGNKSIENDFIVNGKRLVRFLSSIGVFRPKTITFEAIGIKSLNYDTGLRHAQFDVSMLIRCTTIALANHGVGVLVTPKSSNLKSVRIYATDVDISDCPNLSSIVHSAEYSIMRSFKIGQNVGTNVEGFTVQSIVERIWSAQKSSANPKLQSIHVENVNWTDFDVNALSWFADRPTCEFKGTIAIKEDHPQGLPRVTWDLKNKFLNKFGYVDRGVKAENGQYVDSLKLDYQQRPFNPDSASIKGNFYVEAGHTFHFKVRPSSPYENTQDWIDFTLKNGNNEYNGISPKGSLQVFKLKDSKYEETILCKVRVFENGSLKTYTLEKTIEIWNRPAQVGDLVYADGTFSSTASYDGEKTPIGICFYVPPRDSQGNVLTKFADPNDKQLRLMVALEETRVNINGGLTSSLQWGVQIPENGNDDAWNAQYALYDLDSEGKRVNLTSATTKVPNVYDISAVRNLTSRGLDNAYIDPDPSTNPNGESDYRDLNTTDGLLNDGFKCVTPDMAIGDGFAYNEENMSFDSKGERTLNAELARLAGSGYQEGNLVNSGYAKTLKIIAHRNNLLNNDILGADGEVIYQGGSLPLPSASGYTTEIKALGTLIDQLRNWASQSGGLNDPYPSKWQQLAYPFVSACYAYQPTQSLLDGEILADKFKSHNWFAPTEGQLARICWYAKYGTKGGFDAFKDAREKGLLGNLTTTSSDHCSVTECYSAGAWGVGFGKGDTYGYGGYKYGSFVGLAVSAF